LLVWEVEYTDEFEVWWNMLSPAEQDSVRFSVELLVARGPNLGRPHVDTVKASKHTHMKELRSQHQGRPLRTFFAFDPRRMAILLIGGDKTGNNRFYEEMVPLADQLYDAYMQQLKDEGLI
jgi:hypothetical protein